MHYQLLPPCYPQNSYNLFFLVYLLFFIYLFIYFLFIGLFLLFLFYKLPTDLPTYFNLLTFLYLPSYPYIFLPTFIYHSFIYSNMNYLSCCPCWIFCSVYAISTPTTVLPLTYLFLPTFATYQPISLFNFRRPRSRYWSCYYHFWTNPDGLTFNFHFKYHSEKLESRRSMKMAHQMKLHW